VRPRKDRRGVDLISDALPFGRLWYDEPNAVSNAVDYAKFYSRSHDAVIRLYDRASNVIETREDKGEFREEFPHFPFSWGLVHAGASYLEVANELHRFSGNFAYSNRQ
jgi:hypothetical protein